MGLGHACGVRVQKVQRVQRVQRGMLALAGNNYIVSVTGLALCHYGSPSFRAVVQDDMNPIVSWSR